MGIDTGGPAFPREDYQANGFYDDNFGKRLGQEGMQLRDYFAAKAMQGMISSSVMMDNVTDSSVEWAAKGAYRMADAMIKARNQ